MYHVSDRQIALWRQLRSIAFLVALTVVIFQDEPRPGLSGRGLAQLVGVVIGAAAWVVMAVRISPRLQPWATGVCMATGILLTAAREGGYGPCYTIAAVVTAVATLPIVLAAVQTAVATAGIVVAAGLTGASLESIVIWAGALLVIVLLGSIRRERQARAEQDEALAVEQAHTAALDERARLAREIHDVLAHSLSALSVQLETAAALLERDRPADAAVIVDRAGRLARDGLTETRRAVSALRGDPVPLPELVGELTRGYGTDLDAPARFAVEGEPRELGAEVGLALYRSAQEALTNVRKHAPGSAVDLRLEYRPGAVRLTVHNRGPAGPPTTGLSSGYGLTGLRERAELAGGTVEAGPCEDGWRVDVKMPA